MNNTTYIIPAGRLPDVEIYGGDNTPWHLKITDEDGQPFTTGSLSECTFELSAVPYGVSNGIDDSAETVEPVLVVDGSLLESTDGYAIATFSLPTAQTKAMRGKYTYQVKIVNGDDHRILQGKLTVKQNISLN